MPQRPYPPGPPPGKLRATFDLARDPYGFYQKLYAHHDDTTPIHTINGRGWVTRDPDMVKRFFAQDPDDYQVFAGDVLGAVLGERSLLAIDGETHRSDRKLMRPCFHGARMKSYACIMAQSAARSLEGLACGQPFQVHALATQVSQDVILHAVFGIHDPTELARWRALTSQTIDSIRPSMLFAPQVQRGFLGLTPWDRFKRNAHALDALIAQEVQRRRAHEDLGEDIMSMLMQARYEDDAHMTDRDLRDQLLTLLFAGYETTAVSLAWAMHDLHHHPASLAQATREAQSAPDDPLEWGKLPFIKACWQESLRRSPIVPDIMRVARRDVEIAGWEAAPGDMMCVSIWGVHHHPEHYKDPHLYRPERFLEAAPSPWAFLPFGGGHRRCIGAAFASMELSIVLTAWLRQAEFALLDDAQARPVRRSVTIAPSTGVRMSARALSSVGI